MGQLVSALQISMDVSKLLVTYSGTPCKKGLSDDSAQSLGDRALLHGTQILTIPTVNNAHAITTADAQFLKQHSEGKMTRKFCQKEYEEAVEHTVTSSIELPQPRFTPTYESCKVMPATNYRVLFTRLSPVQPRN